MESSPSTRGPYRSTTSHSHQSSNYTTTKKRLHSDGQQAWTAARCQRLLRQLQARLAALKSFRDFQQLPDSSTRQKRAALEDDHGNAAATAKRIRMTYGRRGKAQASIPGSASTTTPPRSTRALRAMRPDLSSPASGPADFRTPIWKKIRARTDTPLQRFSQELDLFDDESPVQMPTKMIDYMRLFEKTVPDAPHKLYEAILVWVHGLLRSTTPQTHQRGSKSLMAMCLRKIPSCIANIQAWDRHHANGQHSSWESSLVAFDMYDQLERFGITGAGWHPLSLVVRSQAIFLLSSAISAELFHPYFTGLLVRLYAHFSCHEEGAKLACSTRGILPEPAGLKGVPSRCDRLQPLFALFRTSLEKKPTSFVFECVASLIQERVLPSGWLCTMDFADLWSKDLEGMASNNAKPSIMRFKQAALVMLARCEETVPELRKSVVEKTLLGVLAGSTAVALNLEQQLGEQSAVGSRPRGTQAFRRLVYLLDWSIAELVESRHRKRLFLLSLARCLAVVDSRLIHDCIRQQAVDDLRKVAIGMRSSARQDARYRQMILLLSEIVLCLRRSGSCVGLGKIDTKLDKLCLPTWLIQATRRDVAFLVAKRTKNLKDLAFAENLPSSSGGSEWHWEEGISEWVVTQTDADRGMATRRFRLRSQTRRQHASHKQDCIASGFKASGGTTSIICRFIDQPGGTQRYGENTPELEGSLEGDKGKRPVIRTRTRPSLAGSSQPPAAGDECDELL